MNKNGWFVVLIIFVLVTVFVLSTDDTKNSKRIRFVNQNFEINNDKSQEFSDSGTNVENAKLGFDNKSINASNTDINLTSENINNSDINFKNKSANLSNQDTGFSQNNFNSQSSKFDNHNVNYKNIDDSNIDNLLLNAKNNTSNHTKLKNEPIKFQEQEQEAFEDIDWNVWHSNFVNKITEDSYSIKELDLYPEGSWFEYSFNVHKNGAISDITVKSPDLNSSDKLKVAKMIKANQYKSITIFPRGTRRQVARVNATIMLSHQSSQASPSDFNDYERVKVKF